MFAWRDFLNRIDHWTPQPWSPVLEDFDYRNDGFLLACIERRKPFAELVGVFDLPRHKSSITKALFRGALILQHALLT
jgi:hypothetical protein